MCHIDSRIVFIVIFLPTLVCLNCYGSCQICSNINDPSNIGFSKLLLSYQICSNVYDPALCLEEKLKVCIPPFMALLYSIVYLMDDVNEQSRCEWWTKLFADHGSGWIRWGKPCTQSHGLTRSCRFWSKLGCSLFDLYIYAIINFFCWSGLFDPKLNEPIGSHLAVNVFLRSWNELLINLWNLTCP